MVGEGLLRRVEAEAIVSFARGSELVIGTILGVGVIGIVIVAVGLVCIIVIIIVLLMLVIFRQGHPGQILVTSVSISVALSVIIIVL